MKNTMNTYKPIYTCVILGLAALPMALFIALLLWAVGAPVAVQLTILVIGVLLGMFAGCLCWSARAGDEA